MSDGYIKKSDALQAIMKQMTNGDISGSTLITEVKLAMVYNAITDLHDEDVQTIKHGIWITDDQYGAINYKCSVCGCNDEFGADNFCPRCGADLRGMHDASI